MATTGIRFECLLPITDVTSADYAAIETFKNNIGSLCPTFFYVVTSQTNQTLNYWAFFGYPLASQQATALTYLRTLNSSLSATYSPILCSVWTETTQP